jgi:hypothetical protein
MRFGEFVFYNTGVFNMDEKAAMLRDCMDVSYEWWVDKLDCAVSPARQRIDCSFETIIERLGEDVYVFVIDRGCWGGLPGDDREHFEAGFRSMEVPIDYFLFIEVESEKMPPILEKYHLVPVA